MARSVASHEEQFSSNSYFPNRRVSDDRGVAWIPNQHRLDDELAADTEALARAEGQSINETVKAALREAVERRRQDPEFKTRLQRIIDQDRELLERLAQ